MYMWQSSTIEPLNKFWFHSSIPADIPVPYIINMKLLRLDITAIHNFINELWKIKLWSDSDPKILLKYKNWLYVILHYII